MNNDGDALSSDDLEAAAKEKQRRVDLDDFHNELAGRETGRQERFLGASGHRHETAEQRREREFGATLRQLLQDAEYRRLYERAWSALDSAQSALDKAMLENAREIERMEADAATLESGEKVFRAADGRLWTAGGRRLSPAEAETVTVPKDAPSYEDYSRAREQERRLAEIQTNTIDPARERLSDEARPLSKDELREVTTKLEGVQHDIERSSSSDVDMARVVAARADERELEPSAITNIPRP